LCSAPPGGSASWRRNFRDAGWQVKGLVRPGRSRAVPRRVEAIEAVTRDEAVAAAQGCDVVLNAFNPVITEWRKNALSLGYAAIAAAEEWRNPAVSGQRMDYGRDMPPVRREHADAAHHAQGRHARRDEQRIREACDRGMRAIILRAGDFFGGGSGSWFDLVIAKDIGRGRLTYPGPLGIEHAWAYLPDFAATLVRLAEQRASFSACETLGFPGHTVTDKSFIATIEAVTKSKFTLRPMSW